MKKLRVAVLMGGPSPERDVSIGTGRQIVTALDPERYSVLPVEITKEGKWLPRPEMLRLASGAEAAPVRPAHGRLMRAGRTGIAATTYDRFVEREQVDVAVIAMHGPYGEDGTMHKPIIVLTACAWRRKRAEHAGCDVFLSKPCLPDALLREVRWLLSTTHDTVGSPPQECRAQR